MKVLLSAYACEPNKGSEPGVGWNWLLALNKMDIELWVLTRANNQESIDNAIRLNPTLAKTNFIYHDLPDRTRKLKKYYGTHLYYELWQQTAYKVAKKFHTLHTFDAVHHLTFGVIRQPSYLYKLGIPFYFGPVGGGEEAPKGLIKGLSAKNKAKEHFRTLLNSVSLMRPALRNCLKSSKIIFCRTNETCNLLPTKIRTKALVSMDVGLYPEQIKNQPKEYHSPDLFNVLYVGRLIYWKGAKLAVHAFSAFHKQYPNSKFTIIGDGDIKQELIQLVDDLNLKESVSFAGLLSHKEVETAYDKADAFLFPSYHDAGPWVIFEALKNALPIVALNLGGIGEILTPDYPSIVKDETYEQEKTIQLLSNQLLKLCSDKTFYQLCSTTSLQKAKENTWDIVIARVYDRIRLVK
jgi:glycosyltransferase involved in cell wall biosynthesis